MVVTASGGLLILTHSTVCPVSAGAYRSLALLYYIGSTQMDCDNGSSDTLCIWLEYRAMAVPVSVYLGLRVFCSLLSI